MKETTTIYSSTHCSVIRSENEVTKQYFKKAFKHEALRLNTKPIYLFLNEIRPLLLTNHVNIVRLFHITENEFSISLILEDGGNPVRSIKENYMSVITQLINAIQYLHSIGIIHGDIKPDNILIKNNIIKLCDFGSSMECEEIIKTPPKGTPAFIPPEVCAFSIRDTFVTLYGKKIDSWALGVSLYLLYHGRHPFTIEGTIFELYETIEKAEIAFDESEVDQIIEKLMIKDPITRACVNNELVNWI